MSMFVIPSLRVSARATINFWVEAFGAELLAIYPEDATDVIDHAELRLGSGRVMAGTPREDGLQQVVGGTSLYWVMDDATEVDAIHGRAVAAGAESLRAPYDAAGVIARYVIRTATRGRSGPTAVSPD